MRGVGVWERLFEDAGRGLEARERFLRGWDGLFEGVKEAFWRCGMGFLRVWNGLFEDVKEALWRGGMGGTDCRDNANA